MNETHPYYGRRAVLATKHGKLAQIAPALRSAVNLEVILADIDTDRFGTFTGEIPRPGDTLQTAVAKAHAAAEAGALPLGLASEGSFGPHPDFPFIPADLEIVVLVDRDLGLNIAEHVLTTETNYAQVQLTSDQSPDDFARAIGFPTHGLVVSPAIGPGRIIKGITDPDALTAAIIASADASPDGQAIVQTDMRAHFNPTRQRQIAEAARRLAKRLADRCPACGTPGWGPIETLGGLPCEICQTPTILARATIDACGACSHRSTRNIKAFATAEYCPYCNP